MVREVIFCTGARSVTAEDILHQTIANLCIQPPSRSGRLSKPS